MKLLIILLSVLATVLAFPQRYTRTETSRSVEANRYSCRWIHDTFQCIYQTCTISHDGKQRCTSRRGPPTAEIIADPRSQLHAHRRQCRTINGKEKCVYQHCTKYADGKQDCTTSKGPPPPGLFE